MPMIIVKYDDANVKDDEVTMLGVALQKIVADATQIPEVFVYADSPKIKIGVAPIEVFVEMSASKVADREALFQEIKNQVSLWKQSNHFVHPITLTLTPVDWRFEVGI
jgi:hypothetical protein